MRKASSFVPATTTRSKYDECELGVGYFLALNIDYRNDDNTDAESKLPKASSVKSSLFTHATNLSKRLGKLVKVKVEQGSDKIEENNEVVEVPGLGYTFYVLTEEQLATMKPRKKRRKNAETVETTENTEVSA